MRPAPSPTVANDDLCVAAAHTSQATSALPQGRHHVGRRNARRQKRNEAMGRMRASRAPYRRLRSESIPCRGPPRRRVGGTGASVGARWPRVNTTRHAVTAWSGGAFHVPDRPCWQGRTVRLTQRKWSGMPQTASVTCVRRPSPSTLPLRGLSGRTEADAPAPPFTPAGPAALYICSGSTACRGPR